MAPVFRCYQIPEGREKGFEAKFSSIPFDGRDRPYQQIRQTVAPPGRKGHTPIASLGKMQQSTSEETHDKGKEDIQAAAFKNTR